MDRELTHLLTDTPKQGWRGSREAVLPAGSERTGISPFHAFQPRSLRVEEAAGRQESPLWVQTVGPDCGFWLSPGRSGPTGFSAVGQEWSKIMGERHRSSQGKCPSLSVPHPPYLQNGNNASRGCPEGQQ